MGHAGESHLPGASPTAGTASIHFFLDVLTRGPLHQAFLLGCSAAPAPPAQAAGGGRSSRAERRQAAPPAPAEVPAASALPGGS